MPLKIRRVLAQILIGLVLVWNLQAALAFLIAPDSFQGAFLLEGVSGRTALRGIGILFLMWQIPYGFALVAPTRHRTSLLEALLMQIVGFVGESALWGFLPLETAPLRDSLLRFMLFDGAGVILLGLALALVSREKIRENKKEED